MCSKSVLNLLGRDFPFLFGCLMVTIHSSNAFAMSPGSDASRLSQSKRLTGNLQNLDERYSKCNGIDVRELTIMKVQELFASNRLTSLTLTNCYLQRISQMNSVLNAVIQVNPDAMRQAVEADMRRNLYAGKRLGTEQLMLGIPVIIKDNIATNDLMETTVGSLALLGIRPVDDADVVKALRKAGVVILGKANLSEFAHYRGTNMPNGWSGRGGQTRNAYNLSGDPSESSSGSAASVAANMAMVSIGTETDGSLMAPASVEGLCTLKPTLGVVSTKGVIPLSHSQDHVGPMARSTTDMAIFLDAMVPKERRPNVDYCGGSYAECLLKRNPQEIFRIGVLRYPFWDASIMNTTKLSNELPHLENIVQLLKNSPRVSVVDPVEYPHNLIATLTRAKEYLLIAHEFKYDFNQYLKNDVTSVSAPAKISTLSDVIRFNERHPIESIYNQDYLIEAEATDGLQNQTYLRAKDATFTTAKALLDSVLSNYNLDAVIAPSEPRNLGFLDPAIKDSPQFAYSLAAMSGYPCLNIPAGVGADRVPFGLTFVGMPHAEAKLLRVANFVEQLAPRRELPKFVE